MCSMRKVFFSLFAIYWLTYLSVCSQTGNILNCENVYQVKESTTLVVLDDSSTTYNEIVRQTIDQYWTISPIKYIFRYELELYLGEREYTMILKNGATRIERRAAGSSEIQFNEIGIYPCNRGYSLSNYHARDAYAKIRVSDIDQPATYLYKLKALIPAMHLYLLYLDQGEINKNNFQKQLDKWMNDSPQVTHDMTLYVPLEEMPPRFNNQESFERYYDHPVRVVPRDTIQHVLSDALENVAILNIHPDLADIQVIASNGHILYAAPTLTYKVLSTDDIINLSRVVSGRKPRKGLIKILNN